MDESRRMGGRFYVVDFEVDAKFSDLPRGCWNIYTGILVNANIRAIWETSGVWVCGNVQARRKQIMSWSKLSDAHFRRMWPKLVEAGLIAENDDGSFSLPMYKRKSDAAINARQVDEMAQTIEEMKQQMAGMMILLQNLMEKNGVAAKKTENEDNGQPNENSSAPEKSGKPLINERKTAHFGASSSINRDLDIDIDPPPIRSSIVIKSQEPCQHSDNGEGGISFSEDQEKLVKELIAHQIKPNKARELVQKYDKERIYRNILGIRKSYDKREKINDPGALLVWRIHNNFIPDEQKESSKERELKQRAEEELAEQQAERERKEAERKKIEAYKDNLNPEEREELRKQALAEIKKMQGIKEEFITDVLISTRENEIVRLRLHVDEDEDA